MLLMVGTWWEKLTRNQSFCLFHRGQQKPTELSLRVGTWVTERLNKPEAELISDVGANFQTFFKQLNVISFFLTNLSKAKFERALRLLE